MLIPKETGPVMEMFKYLTTACMTEDCPAEKDSEHGRVEEGKKGKTY